ncbi:MAG: YCF48-related protein [Bacteroidota bacterium]|nr:YCF48-related protein [Bacteroidota bacterium]MDP4237066.1 YCF48-related protein [Bacteroidota bacterium]
MKTHIVILFTAFFSSTALAQDQYTSPPIQPQEPILGWFQQNSGNNGRFTHVFFKNRDTGYVKVGTTYTLYSTNGGDSWQVYNDSIGVAEFKGDFGYGYSIKGLGWIGITVDNGKNWKNYNTGIDASDNYYFSSSSRGFCSAANFIGRSIDGGKTWTLDTTNVGKISAFAAIDSMRIFAVGTKYVDPNPPHSYIESIFLTTDGGLTWKFAPREHIQNGGFDGVAVLDSLRAVFIASTIFSYFSGNMGYSLVPINFAGVTERHSLEGISASNARNVTVVGEHGKIFRSYDGGINWQEQNSGTQNTLYGVMFIDSITGWAVGDGGIILHTTNGGFASVNRIKSDSLETQIFPDPARENLTLGMMLPVAQHISLSILDISGSILMQPLTNVMESAGFHFIPLDIHSLASAGYILKIQTERYQSVIKFTVVR